MRLENECLLAIRAQPKDVLQTVEALRAAGYPSIFVLRDKPLELAAEDLAATDPEPNADSRRIGWMERLRYIEGGFGAAYLELLEATALGHAPTAAAAWFLDNMYMIRTTLAQVKQDLPRKQRRGSATGIRSQVYQVARNLVLQTGFALTEANIQEALREYQKAYPLAIEELWLFPILLRLALLEQLNMLAGSTSRGQQYRELAFLWADRLTAAARGGPDVLEAMLGRMESEPHALEAPFLASLTEQLQGDEHALAPVQAWMEARLLESPLAIVRGEHGREVAESVATAQAFGGLRTLGRLDFNRTFEAVNLIDAELQRDPAIIYQRSDFATRDQCRREVERIARRSGVTEQEVARLAVSLAAGAADATQRHVTYFLLAEGVLELERRAGAHPSARTRLTRSIRRHATSLYLGSIVCLTLSFTGITLALAQTLGVSQQRALEIFGLLALFPLSELCTQIVNALVISIFPPVMLPKMDFKGGIPPENATLVVVPMMLSSVEVVSREIEKLEVRFLANWESNVAFGLFADFTDSENPTAASDSALLQAARNGIAGLNARYPGERFVLFHRRRVWSESEQKWIGWERKRGKLEELNAFLTGTGSPDVLNLGKLPQPIRYVITLDSDTQLPPGSARRMIETLAHPLNHAELDPQTNVLRKGYAIIQPRMNIALPGATATRFTRIFADTAGTDPYCPSVSDVQQDLFGEGIYHGKAIYDVRAFHAALTNRFPPETLLSHDLIEGSFAGVGLASDIELLENLPLDYGSFVRRQHRWTRGDWQIARWILPRVPGRDGRLAPNPLSLISRWRIFDNLRRSLVPVASLLLLLLGWFVSGTPGVWTAATLAIAIPGIAPLLDRWARHIQGSVDGWQGAADEITRTAIMLAFLPHQAWIAVDAIARACYRSFVSHRQLLEWQTAEAAEDHGNDLAAADFQIRVVGIISGALIVFLNLEGQSIAGTAFLALWLISPLLLRWLGNPARRSQPQLSRSGTLYLRRMARRTWRYFDDLVGENSNWLPPDNSQLALRVEVAPRTSPTNIGLWLVSVLAAYDFGYITADDLTRRTTATMDTLERLERYEGHILNWYDTATLEPLLPRYVSSVDSGNLIASLWTFAQGCEEILDAPAIDPACLKGLSDTVAVLSEASAEDAFLAVPIRSTRRLLRGAVRGHHLLGRLRLASHAVAQVGDLQHWKTSPKDERAYWSGRLVQESASWTAVIDLYLSWMETLASPPDVFLLAVGTDAVSLREAALKEIPSLRVLASGYAPVEALLSYRATPEMRPEAAAWLEQIGGQYLQAKAHAAETVARIESLAARANSLASGMNMRFLYDEKRKLFAVGYTVGGPVEFNSHYDLLASESRLASLVSIAKRDVPTEHWFALGRVRNGEGRHQVLLSWSGTMFEYLMPMLFMRTYTNSLLDQASREAVARQSDYGREKNVPWGISECAYSALDSNQVYQYRAFGVPTLALHQDMEAEPVVAPYATALALMVDPGGSLDNLQALTDLGVSGPMGFYEAIDFSRAPKRGGSPGVVIFAYMAHHQGMSLLALGNTLLQGTMQRRFHSDPRIQAVESLLFERVPLVRMQLGDMRTKTVPVREPEVAEPAERTFTEQATPFPRAYLYGNDRYALMITSSGSGYSRWKNFDISRWQADSTLDPWGSFLYLRETRSGAVWSPTSQPFPGREGKISATFSADHAEFRRTFQEVESVLSVTVAPEDDIELRRLVLTNHSRRPRQLEITSYLELVMSPHDADAAHPAFNKMFIETQYAEEGVLLARRRPRSPEDPPMWCGHMLVGTPASVQYETDRREFLGRGNTAREPKALTKELTCTAGCVLDPIFSLRTSAVILPRGRLEISFLTFAGDSREAVVSLAAKYRHRESVTRAFDMAWTHAQLQFRFLQIGPGATHRFQELASHLLYPNPALRLSPARLARNQLGQAALWGLGISGDLPIVSVTVADAAALSLVRDLLMAHSYWRMRGFRADLVILNQEIGGYDRPLHHQLQRQIDAYSRDAGTDRPGGVFLRETSTLTEEQTGLVLAASRAVFSGARGSLERQLRVPGDSPPVEPFVASRAGAEEPSELLPFLELPYFNGVGGFSSDGREYAIYLGPGTYTPAAWVNVMSNARFGTMVTESGLGFTWCANSQQNRLTPWKNDPLSDPPSEIIYLRDEESGARWTPTALPIREQDAHRARHSQGYSVFEHSSHAISQELTVFVPLTGENGDGDRVKVLRLRLRNESSRTRRLTATYFAELVLGRRREDQQGHVRTMHDEAAGAVFAFQNWAHQSPGQLSFAASSPGPSSYSGDRRAFLGRNRSFQNPAALDSTRLDNRTGAGFDPAAALQVQISLEPGRETDVVFLLGQADSAEEARAVISRYQSTEQVYRALSATRHWWDRKLGAIEVHTPQLSVDFLLNRWLPYQALSCRFWGRSAMYQSGGAFGFRDQLQDSLAFLYFAPALTRSHILASAARQFLEGDVQHWWHADTGLGVRSRCSDDLLWLPWVVAQYITVTGDRSVLDEVVPFIEGPLLEQHEQERVFVPSVSQQAASLWEHCCRAVDRASRLGAHGLPLFGSGDWNDGLNHVGLEGRGESTWLAWFLCTVLDALAQLADPREPEVADRWRRQRASLASAMENTAWDGEWYLRGFFDDGSPLGAHANPEARIDSLPQSWAALSGAADPARARTALEAADRILVREAERLVLLFTPPFEHSHPHPGYIMGYPPGIRENGGQYTHGSLWLAAAWARLGEGARAVRLLNLMNPIERCRDTESVDRYRGEPYVAAADVYSAPGREGQCGWTWYTGSAAWMYRIWIEDVLGFQLRGNRLAIRPAVPPDWTQFTILYRAGSTTYRILVEQVEALPSLVGALLEPVVEVDGKVIEGDSFELAVDGGTHEVHVRIPPRTGQFKQLVSAVHTALPAPAPAETVR
ncbi:MAG TPA: glucoamylase family protein [Bryobacteraceae bacterium]|nr:glucoamylase family protein [Bryobacteraceae bacterium]